MDATYGQLHLCLCMAVLEVSAAAFRVCLKSQIQFKALIMVFVFLCVLESLLPQSAYD